MEMAVKTKKKWSTRVVSTLDKDTGELVERESEYLYHSNIEDSFIKMYIERLGHLARLPHGVITCFIAIVSKSSYTIIVYLLKDDKEKIYKEFGITQSLMEKSVNLLTKHEFLIRLSQGKYLINPNYFARGSWSDIRKVRLQLDFTEDGERQIVIFSKDK